MDSSAKIHLYYLFFIWHSFNKSSRELNWCKSNFIPMTLSSCKQLPVRRSKFNKKEAQVGCGNYSSGHEWCKKVSSLNAESDSAECNSIHLKVFPPPIPPPLPGTMSSPGGPVVHIINQPLWCLFWLMATTEAFVAKGRSQAGSYLSNATLHVCTACSHTTGSQWRTHTDYGQGLKLTTCTPIPNIGM